MSVREEANEEMFHQRIPRVPGIGDWDVTGDEIWVTLQNTLGNMGEIQIGSSNPTPPLLRQWKREAGP